MSLQIICRVGNALDPLLFVLIAFQAILLVLFDIITLRLPWTALSSRAKIQERIFGRFWPRVNHQDSITFEWEKASCVPELVASASGVVLEIGPGSGNQLPRYDKNRVTKIYGVEPNKELLPILQANVKKNGLDDIYTIIPCGVEALDCLDEYGVTAESIDTLLVIQVMCSVPHPAKAMKALYSLLKPAGRLLVYEHVQAADPITRIIQGIYQIFWPYLMGNCHITRQTGQSLLQAGQWSQVKLNNINDEDPWLIFPHVFGSLTKASK